MSIYLDHNATTPVGPEVADAMAAALRALPGNPSSTHASGRAARAAVEDARADVARLVGASADEIVFTSGGTEANDLAIRGLLRGETPSPRAPSPSPRQRGERVGVRGRPHVVTSRLEHPSVLAALAAEDADVTYVAVDPDGRITPDALRAALRPDTVLVTLALANHELGNVYDVAALARVAHDAGALFHADAVQAAGKLEIAVDALGVDALTLSAHKLHGPKGVGAAYIRRGVPFTPLTAGGHQERERRAGTENVSGIVGFGVAARLAAADLANAAARVGALRDRLEARLLAIPGARRNGDGARAAARNIERRFRGRAGAVRRGGAGSRRHQRVDGRGVHLGIAGALRGAAGAGAVGGGGGVRDPDRDRRGEHGGGDREGGGPWWRTSCAGCGARPRPSAHEDDDDDGSAGEGRRRDVGRGGFVRRGGVAGGEGIRGHRRDVAPL